MILEAFTRAFVDSGALDASVAFYKALLSGEQTLRFAYPETGLELAAVSSPQLSVLIIAGPPEKRAPFEATRLTIKVDALEPSLAVLKAAGAEQLEPIQQTPVGRKTRFRHPDGLTVEYVDHTASSAGRP
jgi:catechol 2,3-dioxygenase-like lactoylglutathione lyase family enzyme